MLDNEDILGSEIQKCYKFLNMYLIPNWSYFNPTISSNRLWTFKNISYTERRNDWIAAIFTTSEIRYYRLDVNENKSFITLRFRDIDLRRNDHCIVNIKFKNQNNVSQSFATGINSCWTFNPKISLLFILTLREQNLYIIMHLIN